MHNTAADEFAKLVEGLANKNGYSAAGLPTYLQQQIPSSIGVAAVDMLAFRRSVDDAASFIEAHAPGPISNVFGAFAGMFGL